MTWTIDPGHTTVGFTARHLGLSKVRGQFTAVRGEIEGDPADITSVKGRVEVDTASIDTRNADRDVHLKSPDFFDVETFPSMTFTSKSVRPDGNGYKVVGDLTIKDITHEVALDYEHAGEVVDPFGNRKVGGTLSTTIKRSEWGLTWNVPLDSGGWLVSDNVSIEIDLQVVESKEAAAAA